MAWYNQDYLNRTAITLALPGTSPADFDVTIPPEWDDFWSTIDAAGNELRVVSFDGRTVATYAIDDGAGGALSKANRQGRLRIDGLVVPTTASMGRIHLYWNPSTTPVSGAAAVVMASVQPGYIELGRPGQHLFAHRSQTPKAGRPRDRIHKTVTEQPYVWVDFTQVLGRRVTRGRGGQRHEELFIATMSVVDNVGADQAAMYDLNQMRFVESPRGELWVRVRVKAGSDGDNYTIVLLSRTVQPGESVSAQQLETRIGVAVRDTIDP